MICKFLMICKIMCTILPTLVPSDSSDEYQMGGKNRRVLGKAKERVHGGERGLYVRRLLGAVPGRLIKGSCTEIIAIVLVVSICRHLAFVMDKVEAFCLSDAHTKILKWCMLGLRFSCHMLLRIL